MKKHNSVSVTLRINSDMFNALQKSAAYNNMNVSEQVRQFIDKGLSINSYEREANFITEIIRQELTSIYDVNDIKKIIEQQIERAIKIQIKAGKMSSSSFFLLAQMISVLYEDLPVDKIAEMVENSTKHGVDYMQLKDFKINDFLFDVNHILEKSDYIDRSNYK